MGNLGTLTHGLALVRGPPWGPGSSIYAKKVFDFMPGHFLWIGVLKKKADRMIQKELPNVLLPGLPWSPVVATLAVATTASVVVGVSGGY